MALLRASRPRASAELGYRMFAGVVAGSLTELIGINVARCRNPQRPDYLTPSLIAVGVGVAVAVIDPPQGSSTSGRQGDGWLEPNGMISNVPYSHAQTAYDINQPFVDFEPTDDELLCCGVDVNEEIDPEDPNLPTPCIAEAHLVDRGFQRIKGSYSDLGFELFSEPTAAQRNTLRRISGGANLERPLYIDVSGGPDCGEEGSVYATFTAPAGLVSARHKAIDDAIEKVASGDFAEGY
jgi:hypothetical protein